MTPREILSRMQTDVKEMYDQLDEVEGNRPNTEAFLNSLIDLMGALDIAMMRAGRV